MTAEIERQLKELVAQFGEKQVLEALDPLVTKCKWNDWQCVAKCDPSDSSSEMSSHITTATASLCTPMKYSLHFSNYSLPCRRAHHLTRKR